MFNKWAFLTENPAIKQTLIVKGEVNEIFHSYNLKQATPRPRITGL